MAGVVDCYIEKLPRQEDKLAAQWHKIGQFRQQLPECNHQLVNLKEDKELAKLKKGRAAKMEVTRMPTPSVRSSEKVRIIKTEMTGTPTTRLRS
jgi:hypothetical protein